MTSDLGFYVLGVEASGAAKTLANIIFLIMAFFNTITKTPQRLMSDTFNVAVAQCVCGCYEYIFRSSLQSHGQINCLMRC
jgi:hypothetical protein